MSPDLSQIEISCRQAWHEISNYYEGEIPEDLCDRIERQLQDCNHCRAIYDGLRNTVTLIADGHALELPIDLSERLHSRLRDYLS